MSVTPYFDVAKAADLVLLPIAYRANPDLVNVAEQSEYAVKMNYVEQPAYWPRMVDQERIDAGYWGIPRNPGEDVTAAGPAPVTLRCFLRGYKVDAADPATDPNLKDALRRTIANVVAWRINQRTAVDPGVASASDFHAKSRSFKSTAEDTFPPDWDVYLRPFAMGRALWGW